MASRPVRTCPLGWCRFICMLAAAGRPVNVLVPPIRRVLYERPDLLPGNRLLPDRIGHRGGPRRHEGADVQAQDLGHFSSNPTAFRRKALSEQLLAMISASASDNRSSERLSLIDRRTVEVSAKGNYRPLAASPSLSCSRRLSGSARVSDLVTPEKRAVWSLLLEFAFRYGSRIPTPRPSGVPGTPYRTLDAGLWPGWGVPGTLYPTLDAGLWPG